jgi:hypothetical protein
LAKTLAEELDSLRMDLRRLVFSVDPMFVKPEVVEAVEQHFTMLRDLAAKCEGKVLVKPYILGNETWAEGTRAYISVNDRPLVGRAVTPARAVADLQALLDKAAQDRTPSPVTQE